MKLKEVEETVGYKIDDNKITTFNLFQFCSPEFSFYTKKRSLKRRLGKKKNWIKSNYKKWIAI